MRDGARRAWAALILLAPLTILAVPGEAQTQYPNYTFVGATKLDGTPVTDVRAGETILFKIRVQAGPNLVTFYHDLELRENGAPLGRTVYSISEIATTTIYAWQTKEVTIRWEQGRVLPGGGTPAPGRYAVVYDDPSNSNVDAWMVLDVDYEPNFIVTKMVTKASEVRTVAGKTVYNTMLLDVEGCVHNNGIEPVTSVEVGLGFRTPIDPSTQPPRIVQTQTVNLATAPTCVSKYLQPPNLQGRYFIFSWLVPQDAAKLSLLASQVVLAADPLAKVTETSELDNERTSPLPAVLS